MKLDYNVVMLIANAIAQVEGVVKGSGNKRQKAIAIAVTSLKDADVIAGAVSPKAEAKIGTVIDAVVELSNQLQAAGSGK